MGRDLRLILYLLITVVATATGFYLGERSANPPGCDDVGECSLGTEVGLVGAAGAAVIALALIGVVELARRLLGRQPKRSVRQRP